MEKYFGKIFQNLKIPVIVCKDLPDRSIEYVNSEAMILLKPEMTADSLKNNSASGNRKNGAETSGFPDGGKSILDLGDLLRFMNSVTYGNLFAILDTVGSVSNFEAGIYINEGTANVTVTANKVSINSGNFIIIYLQNLRTAGGARNLSDTLSSVLQVAFHIENVDTAINKTLEITGTVVGVSRVYIFEEISAQVTCNTYEWCGAGINPEIENLQNLRKEDYNYDAIISGGAYITGDIRTLPDNDRMVLQEQGIKSLAILPLFHFDKPLGYIGFDDCSDYRKWGTDELRLLKEVSDIVVSLLIRRNTENHLKNSLKVMQTISDNMDSIIYVTDIETKKIIFMNKTLADSFDKKPEEMVDKICWQALQSGQTGVCTFCPVPKLIDEDGNKIRDSYNWEFQNTVTGKWYLVQDSVIDWIDGRKVHIETATEITQRKVYEENLVKTASTDAMTGVYNREWGYAYMKKALAEIQQGDKSAIEISLVFMDIDNLKSVNDKYGHKAGDELITSTISNIRRIIRQSDHICRWGGDEFILLLHCDYSNAENIMKKIDDSFAELNGKRTEPYGLQFSYGITCFNTTDEKSLDRIIESADELMYRDKINRKEKGGRR